MAENQEQQAKPKEREIPVFTVLKNNCILKNIFLLDNPPSISSSPPVSENADQEFEEMLVVGRHPDCNIKLEHPSISRFHLRLHSKPSSRSLYVTDLSSVHGTWISGKKIEPGVRMKLNEGDSLRLGASSRLYRLNWVPLSRAYDINDPFVPQMDDPDTVDQETDEIIFDQSLAFDKNDQVDSPSDNVDGLESLFFSDDFDSSMKNTSPIAPLMRKDLCNSVSVEVEKNSSPGLYSPENSTSAARRGNTNTSPEMASDEKPGLGIWSRSGISQRVQIKSSSQVKSFPDENKKMDIGQVGESFMHEKGNASPDSLLLKSPKSKSREKSKNEQTLNTFISSADREEDFFTPGKENMTPNTRLFRSMKKNPKSSPLKTTCTSNMYQEEDVIRSSEASQCREIFQESVSTNFASNGHCSSKKKPVMLNAKETSVCENMVAKNRWIIVVDTTSLLNKKSRNQLHLLRGLRGTTLVFPRIVVRELGCMSRRGSLFTRKSEVSAALQYIEECTAVAKWSGEDMWPISIGSTPSAGDHIIEYALYRREMVGKDERLVVLTDDVTLKIKAMAQGVLCETAEEFRRSLVNPFSARFLYNECSPLGPTWSCADDVVLKEKYYPSPSTKVVSRSGEGGGAKGLKLVLMMHNSSLISY